MCTKHNALPLPSNTCPPIMYHPSYDMSFVLRPFLRRLSCFGPAQCTCTGSQDMCAESTKILHAFDLCYASSLNFCHTALVIGPSPFWKPVNPLPCHRSKQIIAYISAVVYSRTFLFLVFLCL